MTPFLLLLFVSAPLWVLALALYIVVRCFGAGRDPRHTKPKKEAQS